MTQCTTADCGMDATLYLCPQCIRDLQAWIDKVPDMMQELLITMGRLDNTRTAKSEGGNGLTTEPSALISDRLLELRTALRIWENQNAEQLAHDQHSGNFIDMFVKILKRAENAIDLPKEEPKPDPEQIAKQLEGQYPEALTPSECATWLRSNAGISIAARNINDWYHRGKIKKQEGSTPKRPLYSTKEVLLAHMTRQHE